MGKTTRSVSIDDDLNQRLDARHDINVSAVVNRFLREFMENGKSPDVALAIRLQEIENQLEEKRGEKASLESQIERLEREREQVQSQIDKRAEAEETAVDEVVEKVHRGGFPRQNIDPDNPAIRNWAADAGMAAERFVTEVEARLSEGSA